MADAPPPARDQAPSGPAPARGDARSTTWLLSAVSAAYDAPTPQEALHRAVELFCTLAHWPAGHALPLPARPEDDIWSLAEDHRYAPFVAATAQLDAQELTGFRAEVVQSRRPMWVADLQCTDDPRAAVAAEVGLRTCVLVPVVSKDGVDAVFELFHEQELPVDDNVLSVLMHLGTQLAVRRDALRVQQRLAASEKRLLEAQALARVGSWSWDVGADHVEWSPQMYAMYGMDADHGPVRAEETIERVHPDHRSQVAHAVQQTVETMRAYEHDYRIVLPGGEVRWMHARGEVLEQVDGRATRVGGYCQDVTEQRLLQAGQRLAERELSNHHRILEQIARGLPLLPTLERICSDVEQSFPGTHCTVMLADPAAGVLRPGAAPSLPAAFTQALDGLPMTEGSGASGTAVARRHMTVVHDALEDPLTEAFVELATAYGLRSVWAEPLVSAAGEVLGAIAVYRSMPHSPHHAEVQAVAAAASLAALAIERDRSESALKRAASVDELTGLPNRRRFLEELEGWLAQSEVPVAVLFMDLDRFNWINDSLGHEAGDRILVHAAQRLQQAVGEEGFVARFGGDEFTALVPHARPDLVDRLADQIEAEFLRPFVIEDGEFFLSTSIGVALNDYPVSAADLVRDADSAMYAAKESGRARRAMFDEGMRARAIDRLVLENELRRALDGDELVLAYQPIVDLATGVTTDVEALVRWQHPTRGLLPPADFIPLAEETGLIVPLGLVILERAVSDAASWAREGLTTGVTVNVSAIQLADPSFAAAIEAALLRHELPPAQLLLEVTESAVMERIEQARQALEKVVSLGVRVLIDDFGTGYSSIARLGELPVVGLKVDRRFTEALGSSAAADGLFASIAGLGHALGLLVVVEGIAEPHVLDLVRSYGCAYGQGFHLAPPMPLAELMDLLAVPAG